MEKEKFEAIIKSLIGVIEEQGGGVRAALIIEGSIKWKGYDIRIEVQEHIDEEVPLG